MVNFLKILFLSTCLGLFTQSYSNFQIVEVFPNTIDDSSLEYITIKNISEEEKSLEGYILADLKKEYIVSTELILGAGEEYIFLSPETKLVLNNSDEEIFLYNSEREIIDSIEYKNSIKGEVLFFSGDEEATEIETEVEEQIEEKIELEEITDVTEEENIEESDKLQVLLELQRPSYITQSGSSNTYICDSGQDECKVNFNLESSFDNSSFKKSDYHCEIDFGGVGESEKEKCNPNTVIFPEGKTQVIFRIFNKGDSQLSVERVIHIVFDRSLPSFEEVIEKSKTPKLALGKPNIIVQSGLMGMGTNFYCEKQPCKFNLNYDKIHKGESCFWDFGPGTSPSMTTRERCNPGYVDIPEGSFVLALRVYEKSYPSNSKTTKFYIHNIPVEEKNELDEENNVVVQVEENLLEKEEVPNVVEEKIESEIVLQGKIGKEKTLSGNILTCSDVESCFVNFNAEGFKDSEKYEYSWTRNTEEFSQDINPKGFWVTKGEHTIQFRVSNSGSLLDEKVFHVSVKEKQEKLTTKTPKITREDTISEPILFAGIESKPENSEFLLPKSAFTQNYLVLKYDGLRISGKAPLGSKLEIYLEGEKFIEGKVDEKGKYRLVSKSLPPGEYNFETKLILESGEVISLSSSKSALVSQAQVTLWNTPKKTSSRKSSSSTSTTTKKLPSLVIKNTVATPQEGIEELTFLQQLFISILVLLTMIFGIFHIVFTQSKMTPKNMLGFYSVGFLVRQKVCMIIT